jgi:hypothetical protein
MDTSWGESLSSAGDILHAILRESIPKEIHEHILSIVPELSPEIMRQNREEALERLQARLDFAVKTKNDPRFWGADPNQYETILAQLAKG